MRVDVVSIFPAYLDPLRLSLPGRAVERGLLDLHVHDLRDWTHDRHRTVDDSPYGGGAGMVMRPEPWGEALDALAAQDTVLVVPTPSGRRFTQALAADLARERHLLVACGRYEGIDQRVVDHAAGRLRVVEVSLGDYVLNGGEVAALAVLEAVVRLLPGFMGNPESLVEESHADGLLEYPVYTKPALWRGLAVPEVLLSGDHARVASWRHEQALRRTVARRPDLARPTALLGVGSAPDTPASDGPESRLPSGVVVAPAVPSDAGELMTLQRACWVQEARANDLWDLPALTETLAQVRAWLGEWTVLTARSGDRLVGAVRGRATPDGGWEIGRLMVAPDLQGRGLGRALLALGERAAPASATAFRLFTGTRSEANLRRYRRAGYRVLPEGPAPAGASLLEKRRRPGPAATGGASA